MHFMLSWSIDVAGADRTRIERQLRQELEGYAWVRAFPGTYVVQVDDEDEWDQLREGLVGAARAHPGQVHVILGPVIDGGHYAGWLPRRLWPAIRERTE